MSGFIYGKGLCKYSGTVGSENFQILVRTEWKEFRFFHAQLQRGQHWWYCLWAVYRVSGLWTIISYRIKLCLAKKVLPPTVWFLGVWNFELVEVSHTCTKYLVEKWIKYGLYLDSESFIVKTMWPFNLNYYIWRWRTSYSDFYCIRSSHAFLRSQSLKNVSLLVVAAYKSLALVQTGIYEELCNICGYQTGHECAQWLAHRYKLLLVFVIKTFEYIIVSLCEFFEVISLEHNI